MTHIERFSCRFDHKCNRVVWAVEVGVKVLEIYFGYGLGQQLYTLASGFDANDGHQLSSEEYTRAWGGFLGMVVGTFAGLGVSRGVQAGARGTAIRERVMGDRCSWKLSEACFAAGTMLLTPDGSVAIETLQVGDVVLSRSEYDANGPLRRSARRVLPYLVFSVSFVL